MKIFAILSAILLLSGCGLQTEVWETVEDPISVSSEAEPIYDINIGLPEAALTDTAEHCCRYETESLQVETSSFFATDLNDAVLYLTGFEAEKLTILQTGRFGLPEYQFAWYSQTEEGGRLYRADLLMDGMTCYAVVCSYAEDAGENAWDEACGVFSAFGLSPIEAV